MDCPVCLEGRFIGLLHMAPAGDDVCFTLSAAALSVISRRIVRALPVKHLSLTCTATTARPAS